MVDLLRQLVECGSKDIDAFVFPFLPTGDSYKECILGHHSTQLFASHLAQGFTGFGTFAVEIFPLGHIGRFKTIGRLYIHFLVEQLGTLTRRDIADRCEAIGGVGSLFLDRVLGHHVEFRRHLVAVVAFEIVVQRLAVTRYRTTDAGSVCGEERSYLRSMVTEVEDRKSRLPLVGVGAEVRT